MQYIILVCNKAPQPYRDYGASVRNLVNKPTPALPYQGGSQKPPDKGVGGLKVRLT